MGRHVLIIVENLTVPRDRRVWNEATTLRAAGYDVTVVCPFGPGYEDSEEVLDGVRILRHPVPEATNSRAAFAREYVSALRWERRIVRRVWREQPFQVIHLCNPPDLLFLVARPYRRRHGVRVVFDHHDLSPELYETKFKRRGSVYAALRLAERLTFRNVDRVLSTNETMREIAIARGEVDPRFVTVVRNGPDLEAFAPRQPDDVVRRGRRTLVGWVGHMADQAGLPDLIHAARVLKEQPVHFMVIGDGPARATAQQLARENGVEGVVEFTGVLYGDELVRHLSSCDMGLLTVRKTPWGNASTPIKIMEYMALRLPVVQYDLLESRRTAQEAALYARPDDPDDLAAKIQWLSQRPKEREKMGEYGRARVVNELAWRHQATRLLDAYGDLFACVE